MARKCRAQLGNDERWAAAVSRLWPTNVTAHVLAMVATWLLSLGAGALLERLVSAMPRG